MGTPPDDGEPIEALCQSMEKENWLWAAAEEVRRRAELTRVRGRSCMAWFLAFRGAWERGADWTRHPQVRPASPGGQPIPKTYDFEPLAERKCSHSNG
jgi:hypothetical protein